MLYLFYSTIATVALGEERTTDGKCLPKDLRLQDDTLEDHVIYSDPNTTPTYSQLTSLQQAVVLGEWSGFIA